MSRHKDPEARLHCSPVKVRLMPGQMDRLQSLARARDVPPAVLARELLLRQLAQAEQAEQAEQADLRRRQVEQNPTPTRRAA